MVRGLIISLYFLLLGLIFSCNVQKKRCQSVNTKKSIKYTIDFAGYETNDTVLIDVLKKSIEYAKSMPKEFEDCLNEAFFLIYMSEEESDTIIVNIVQDDDFLSDVLTLSNYGRNATNKELLEEVFYSLQTGVILFKERTFIILSPENFGDKLNSMEENISFYYSYFCHRNQPVLFNFNTGQLKFLKGNIFFELKNVNLSNGPAIVK